MTSELAEHFPELDDPAGLSSLLQRLEQSSERVHGSKFWRELDRFKSELVPPNGPAIYEGSLYPLGLVGAAARAQIPAGDRAEQPRSAMLQLAACANWRMGRGTYVFSKELAEMIDSSDGAETIPGDVLRQLPEFGIWVSCPDPEGKSPGAFVWMDSVPNQRKPMLTIAVQLAAPESPAFAALHIVLSESPIFDFVTEHYERKPGVTYAGPAEMQAWLKRLIQRLAYLCSSQPDIAPPTPAASRYLSAPSKEPQVWEVGYRIAREIRAARETEHGQGGGGPKRPHLRRAHWHTYRVGKGRQGTELKFLLPIIVGGSTDSAPVVIRPQEPTR